MYSLCKENYTWTIFSFGTSPELAVWLPLSLKLFSRSHDIGNSLNKKQKTAHAEKAFAEAVQSTKLAWLTECRCNKARSSEPSRDQAYGSL